MRIEDILKLNREELKLYYERPHSLSESENNTVLKNGRKVIVIDKPLSQFLQENNLVEIKIKK